MNKSFKKRLSVAVLAGCSVLAITGISFANPADKMPPPPPPYHGEMMQDFDSRPMPPGVEHQQYKAQYKEYASQFKDKYSWMSDFTRKRAAMNFVSVDKALADNKLSENQATVLKKELISFYRDEEKNMSEAKDSKGHKKQFSLDKNIPQIAQNSNIPVATVEKVLRPHKDDFKGQRPNPPKVKHENKDFKSGEQPKQMQERANEFRHRFADFTNELIQEGKLTQPEADTLGKYMQDTHEKFAKMNDEERSNYIKEVKNMSKEDRLAAISADTGISTDRLQSIFDAAREKIQSKFPHKDK